MKKLMLLVFIPFAFSISQELNCTVTVNYEGLAVNYREKLVDFAGVIESYMNTTQFTSEVWDGQKIDCSINIFFTAASGETEYTAQAVIVSTRPIYKTTRQSPMITISDANWSFKYERNQALYANQNSFDPLTSFLDFYANIIIGFDWETWAELGGTQYFKKASDIVNLSSGSSYKTGWEQSSASYSKWGLCNDLLNDKYRPFREAFFVYHYGVDEYQIRKKEAQAKILQFIAVLEDMQKKTGINNSVLIKQFFDVKNGEIIELLKDHSDPLVFQKLKKIDPPHAAKYDEVLK